MASSGMFTKSINSWARLELEWEIISQSIPENESVVEARLYFDFDNAIYSSASKTSKLQINGSLGTYSFTIGSRPNGARILCSTRRVTVPHNSDGTKSASISGNASIEVTLSGTYYGTVSVSGTANLNTIPRSSSISYVTSSVSVNGSTNCHVNISRASSSFTHRVKWSIGSYSKTETGVGTSTAYIIPMSWLNAIPNSTSGTAKVEVTTYSGSTKIGSTVSKSFKITCPSSVVPSISTVTATRVDNNVPSAWGVYVQNQSSCTVAINGASSQYGATIKKYEIYGHGISATSSSTTFKFGGSGSMTFTGRVTDSRGRTATKTVTVYVEPWSAPKINSVGLDRALSTGAINNDGTYGRALVNFSYSTVAGNNVTTRLIEYRVQGDSTWTNGGSFSNLTAQLFGAGGISVNNTYEIQITVSDQFETVTWQGFLSTSFVTMDFKAGGRGIAFGKVSEVEDTIESAFPIQFTEGLVFDGVDTGWINNTGLTITTGSDWELISYVLRRRDNKVWGTVEVKYVGTNVTAGSTGNFTDKNGVFVLPATFQNGAPIQRDVRVDQHGQVAYFGRIINNSGQVDLTHGLPGVTLANGHNLIFWIDHTTD